TNFRRQLDLASALATTEFEIDGVKYKRTVFASNPAQVIAVYFTCGENGSISFTARLDRDSRNCCKGFGNNAPILANTEGQRPADALAGGAHAGSLLMEGALPDGKGGANLHFAAALGGAVDGGTLEIRGDSMRVQGAKKALLVMGAATSYYHPGEDLVELALA